MPDARPLRPSILDPYLPRLQARLAEGREDGLVLDGAAIRAALTTPWSSRQPEGRNTRLTQLERHSYGRAGFDLLRRHVQIPADPRKPRERRIQG